jgi:putative ABC transport system permease protein
LLVAALRDLQWRRRRFLITVLGTALVFAMTLLLAGLSAAFDNEVDRTLTTTGADEWAISAGATGPFNSSAVMPDGALAAVRGTPGVQDADPFVAIGATIPGDTPKHVMMIGTVPGGVGSPSVDEGRAPRTAGEVAVGDRLGKEIGDRFRMGARDLKVVGIVDGSSLFGGMPNVWLTMDDVQALTFGGAPLYTAVAIRGHASETPEGLKVASVSETTTDLLQSLGSGQQTIDFLAILLWIIAACIVGSVIYLSALERVRDFAVLKAVGGSSRSLAVSLAVQAVLASLLAALLGAGLAQVLAPAFPMPVVIERGVYLALPLIAVVVGVLASLPALRRAIRVDPALAFAG